MIPSALPFWALGAAWGILAARPARPARAPASSRWRGSAALGARAAPRAIVVGVGPARATRRRPARPDRARRSCRPGRPVVHEPRTRTRAGDAELARELPVVLDLLGVAVGAGCTPYLAVEVAARWSPRVDRRAAPLRCCAPARSA